MTVKVWIISGLVILSLAGCDRSQGIGKMLNLVSTSNGPDEFSILPNNPLEQPDNYTDLPEPMLGGGNLVDPTPKADAIAALGGRSDETALRNSEKTLVAHASRMGVNEEIRQELKAEDEAFRRDNQGLFLERLLNANVYFSAYSGMSLDVYAELERLRSLGLRTPTAPPPAEKTKK